jgi:hypothetical protein
MDIGDEREKVEIWGRGRGPGGGQALEGWAVNRCREESAGSRSGISGYHGR